MPLRSSDLAAFVFSALRPIGARRTRSVSLRRTLVEAVSGAPLSAAASSRSRGFENRGSPRSLAGVRLRDTDSHPPNRMLHLNRLVTRRPNQQPRDLLVGDAAKDMAFARQKFGEWATVAVRGCPTEER